MKNIYQSFTHKMATKASCDQNWVTLCIAISVYEMRSSVRVVIGVTATVGDRVFPNTDHAALDRGSRSDRPRYYA